MRVRVLVSVLVFALGLLWARRRVWLCFVRAFRASSKEEERRGTGITGPGPGCDLVPCLFSGSLCTVDGLIGGWGRLDEVGKCSSLSSRILGDEALVLCLLGTGHRI